MADISILNGYYIKDKKARKLIADNILNNPLGSDGMQLVSHFNEYIANTNPSGNASFKSLQSGVYIDDADTIILAYSNANTYTQAILVTYDTSFNIIGRSAALNVGHCGDMAYKSANRCIYCACGATGVNAGKIAVIDTTSMTITAVINSPTTRAIKIINYDPASDRFFMEDDLHWIVCDGSFNVISISDLTIDYSGTGTLTHQSGFCYNGVNYILYDATINAGYNAAYIVAIDDDGTVLNSLTVPIPSTTLEAEAIVVKDNVGYLCCGQTWLSVFRFSMTNDSLYDINDIDYAGVIRIASGDLNDYGAGYYFISSAAEAAAIANTPIDTSGMLIKSFYAGNYLYQEALTNTFQIYLRRCTSGNWNAWHNMSGTAESITLSYESGVTPNDVQAYHIGEQVTINGRFTRSTALTASTWNTIATVPMAPPNQVQFMGITITPSPLPLGVRITSAGLLQVYPSNAATDVRLSISYRI